MGKLNYDQFNSLMKTHTDDEKKNTSEMCKHCERKAKRGLSCCEGMPCEIHPEDLKEITEENIRGLISSGLVSIDYWEGDTEDEEEYFDVPYLRMRAVNDNGPVCRSWGGGVCRAC